MIGKRAYVKRIFWVVGLFFYSTTGVLLGQDSKEILRLEYQKGRKCLDQKDYKCALISASKVDSLNNYKIIPTNQFLKAQALMRLGYFDNALNSLNKLSEGKLSESAKKECARIKEQLTVEKKKRATASEQKVKELIEQNQGREIGLQKFELKQLILKNLMVSEFGKRYENGVFSFISREEAVAYFDRVRNRFAQLMLTEKKYENYSVESKKYAYGILDNLEKEYFQSYKYYSEVAQSYAENIAEAKKEFKRLHALDYHIKYAGFIWKDVVHKRYVPVIVDGEGKPIKPIKEFINYTYSQYKEELEELYYKYQVKWESKPSERQKYTEVKPFKNGMANVKIGKKWGVVNANFELVIPVKYSKITSFSYGYCLAQQKKKELLLLNQSGKVVGRYNFNHKISVISNPCFYPTYFEFHTYDESNFVKRYKIPYVLPLNSYTSDFKKDKIVAPAYWAYGSDFKFLFTSRNEWDENKDKKIDPNRIVSTERNKHPRTQRDLIYLTLPYEASLENEQFKMLVSNANIFQQTVFFTEAQLFLGLSTEQLASTKHGVVHSSLNSGDVFYEYTYRFGSRSGLFKEFYPGGKLKAIGRYKFDADGENGLKWDVMVMLNPDGNVLETGTLANGSGSWYNYNSEGKLYSIDYYENGLYLRTESP